MDVEVRDFFDDVYQRYTRYWAEPAQYSADPSDYGKSSLTGAMLSTVTKSQRRGRALDIGAGEGADAIRLARLGYEVDAIEGSEVGAQKAVDFAREARVRVNVSHSEAEDWDPTVSYDVIVCHGVLHYVRDKPQLLRKIQAATAPGGFNSISVFSTYSPVPDCHTIIPVYPDAEDGVLTSEYSSWEASIWTPRVVPEHSHPGFEPHSHSYVKMLSRRQGN